MELWNIGKDISGHVQVVIMISTHLRNLFMLLYLNRTYDHIAALPKRCLYTGPICTQQSSTPTLQYSSNIASPEPFNSDIGSEHQVFKLRIKE